MNTKLLSNRELEDFSTEDTFNFKVKADAIKAFLEYNSTALKENKMLVLYGDWGSGKTSLMRYIEKEINKDIYYPIFFDAWEHEKDENLPLSLCDALMSITEENNEIIKDFIKGAIITLKSFASGVTLKAPGYLSGLGLDLEFSGEKFIKAIDEALKKPGQISFYKSNKEFKDSFRKIEDLILKKTNAQKILIFVDDLDRCEPENVLNLITALKLFFTYGEKSVFICGIDKEAVTKAVKTKYMDVVKSEEYMEKVFDISFNMPKTFSLTKILETHFYNFEVEAVGQKLSSLAIIEDFFKAINFDNPRHLKKVLNKYKILKTFKELAIVTEEFQELIPNIIFANKTGKIFETIYCLYIIVLYEFFPNDFKEVENYQKKMIKYTDILHSTISSSRNYSKAEAAIDLNRHTYIPDIEKATYNQINQILVGGISSGFSKFLYIFSNNTPTSLYNLPDHELNKYPQFFTDNSLSTNFCKFLIKYSGTISQESADSNYKIYNIFNMVKYLL